MRSNPERGVQVQALAGDIVLCSRTRQLTLAHAVPLSTQVYKWIPVNLRPGSNAVLHMS